MSRPCLASSGPGPHPMSPVRWTADRMDQLESAARRGQRVALSRRGTEYIVVALRVTSGGPPRGAGRLPAHDRRGAHLPAGSDRQLPGRRVSGIAILHLDESCLGNGREGENPGGGGGLDRGAERQPADPAAGLLPQRAGHDQQPDGARRRDRGACELLSKKGARLRVLIVSDSQYLVKGMREWVPGWVGARLEAEGRPDREPRALEGPARELAAARRAVDLGARAQGSREERVRQRPRGEGRPGADHVGRHRGVGIRRVARGKAGEGTRTSSTIRTSAFAALERRLAADEAFALADGR